MAPLDRIRNAPVPKLILPDALETTMPYGKFKGQTLEHIAENNPRYLDWLIGTDIKSPTLKKAVEMVHAHFDAEIAQAVADKEDGPYIFPDPNPITEDDIPF
jgi:uncharacterized protein (DUF3820 family)